MRVIDPHPCQTKLNGASTGCRLEGAFTREPRLIDYLTLALTHGLMALALWRLLWRDDLDADGGVARQQAKPWLRNRDSSAEEQG